MSDTKYFLMENYNNGDQYDMNEYRDGTIIGVFDNYADALVAMNEHIEDYRRSYDYFEEVKGNVDEIWDDLDEKISLSYICYDSNRNIQGRLIIYNDEDYVHDDLYQNSQFYIEELPMNKIFSGYRLPKEV